MKSPASRTTSTGTKQRGEKGEALAAQFLESRGFCIVERNWRPGNSLRGEVDLIAWHGNGRQKVLCFVEVKTRSSNHRGTPQEAVNTTKQRQLSRLANAYVSLHRIEEACRFDVVEVWMPDDNSLPRIALRPNAFDYHGF